MESNLKIKENVNIFSLRKRSQGTWNIKDLEPNLFKWVTPPSPLYFEEYNSIFKYIELVIVIKHLGTETSFLKNKYINKPDKDFIL